MLTSLALEILLLILDRLPTKALLSLRAICKAFLHIITPRVLSEVCFDLDFGIDGAIGIDPHRLLQRPLQLQRQLQVLSNPSCTISPYVISLVLESPCSSDEWHQGYVSSELLVRTALSQHLAPSILNMRNLKTVR
jgi:hypothetical protein